MEVGIFKPVDERQYDIIYESFTYSYVNAWIMFRYIITVTFTLTHHLCFAPAYLQYEECRDIELCIHCELICSETCVKTQAEKNQQAYKWN